MNPQPSLMGAPHYGEEKLEAYAELHKRDIKTLQWVYVFKKP